MSYCTKPIDAAKMAVTPPTVATTSIAFGASVKISLERATKYTPAVTIVAAWISADTGVGPSMASGSQTCSGSCADLPAAPTKKSRPIRLSGPQASSVTKPPAASAGPTSVNFSVPSVVNVSSMPSTKPASPMRLTMKALLAALDADCLRK